MTLKYEWVVSDILALLTDCINLLFGSSLFKLDYAFNKPRNSFRFQITLVILSLSLVTPKSITATRAFPFAIGLSLILTLGGLHFGAPVYALASMFEGPIYSRNFGQLEKNATLDCKSQTPRDLALSRTILLHVIVGGGPPDWLWHAASLKTHV